MPIIKSAIKRVRQTAKRRSQNLRVKAAVKQDVRTLMDALALGDAKASEAAMRAAQSEIDRAVKKGTLHKNTAARRKSRLVAASVKALAPAEKAETKPKAKTASTAKKSATKKPVAKKSPAKKPAAE
jgi:ribosomal protein S20